MRRRLSALVTTLAVLTVCTLAQAAEQRRPSPQDAQAGAPGITSVTDANGNPVPLRENAAADPNALVLQPKVEMVQRGQAWWPYESARAPYTFVNKPAESMTENEIQVNGVALIDIRDPEATLKLIPTDLRLAVGAQLKQRDGFYLLKIAGMSRTQEQIDALKSAGVVLGEYMNINTYMAKIPATSFNAVRSLPFVTFIGDYEPAYKISPRIGLESIPETEAIDTASGLPRAWVFEVTLHNGADLKDALDGLARYGMFPEKKDIVATDEMTVVYVRTVPENVLTIAQLPEIKWIAEKTYAKLLASATNPATVPMVLQNNGTYTTNTALGWKLWNAGIDGSATSQIITMEDSGLNTKMEHFAESTSTAGTIGVSHRKVIGYDVDGGDQCVLAYTSSDGGHGTWTSQHALGSISNMTSPQDSTHTPNAHWDDGIARGAKVYFRDIGLSTGSINPPADLGPSITTAISKGSFIENNSWGTSSPTYDTTASSIDTALFNNPNFVVTVSAGNNGTAGNSTIGSPSTSKNCICVGGNDVASPNRSFQDCNWDGTAACGGTDDLGSSRGPVSVSNRIKPDIMTFVASSASVGGEIMAGDRPSAMCQTDATKTVYWDYVNTNLFGGTSFAAPQAAGLAALVRDYFMQGFYPTGSAVGANAITPSGSLVKAVILASGEAMDTVASPSSSITLATRYSSDVGYGRANLPGILHIGAAAPFLWTVNNKTLGQAATDTTFYNINGNGMPLRVMLVWYDAAGNAIQKNADLRVTIGANVYRGNVMTAGWSTTGGVADATNTSEGVFLDAAHGLPSSGTVQVEVIGTNNPGGMNYSLVVTGNVASALVKQVSLDKGQYTCAGPINVSVNDTGATSPVSVTLTSKNNLAQVIDTKVVSCTGSGGVFSGSILAGSGITVANGGTVTATYSDASPATATIACQAAVLDGGFIVGGGCDNAAAGTNVATGPLTNGGSNEYYNKYMDANEYTSYKFAFVNNTGAALSDVYVALSFSGAGAANMTAFNGPIHVGPVAAGATAGGVFQLYTSAATAGLTAVSLNFAITSPADGYTTPTTITQAQLLHTNDQIARQNRCSTFNTTLVPWVESAITGAATNPWRWSGAATTPATVSSENRVDGVCGSATINAAAMTGNSAITTGNNFSSGADSVLLQNFQPALTGNGPNGQPYHYAWAWNSFYHASETLGATTGVWGIFYNDQWNSAVNPTGDQVVAFSNNLSYYYQTIFDYVGTWNWETLNTGTPDVPGAATPAPNQLIITFTNVTGLATPTTYFAYGHEHADVRLFGGTSSNTTRRDIAFDNDNLVYDEYYAAAQAAACGAGTQVGQVAFDQVNYGTCPTGSAVLSVLDANGVSGMTVTVTSPGTGDSELVTLTGSAPYFTGTLTFSTVTGVGNNNGTLFVLPTENISATYTDASPAGSSSAIAAVSCTGGDVVYVTNTQVSDNGDNDGIADNNECVTMDITIRNNLATSLTNTKVTIFSNNSRVDLIPDDHAAYGTVAAGASATNPVGDRFTFHVASSVQCVDPANPPSASFTVVITADGINGSTALQTFAFNVDLDIGAGTVSYTQNFTVNPGWTTGVTSPDNAGCTANTYTNDFHWCAACGNAGAGYGAWVGNSAFGTAAQNYTAAYNSSTLFSPVFTAGSTAVTMQFREAARTETTFDGAIVQYKLGAGNWTTLGYTTPAQAATTAGAFCSPILASTVAWTGTATAATWTLTNAASVTTTAGQSIQFRWRLGGDVSGAGTTYGGFGVDDVTVTGLRNFQCEATRPSGVGACCLAPSILTNNTAVDANLCSATGIQVAWPQDPDNWGDGGVGVRTYDVLRNGSPIASGIAYGNTSYLDASAVAGTTYTYTVRYNNGCGGSSVTTGVARADSGAVTCTASDQCHVAGVCAPATGICSNPTQPNGNACNDANACTQTDTCQSGVCTGTNPVVCTASDQCHDVGVCNPGTGVCSNPAKANGSSCADGNQCTTSDTCQSGVCTAGAPVVCTASDQCHVAGVCNPGTGVCTNPNAGNGTTCSDGNACSQTDTCQSGVCTGSNPVVCTASDQCHVAGTCNPGTGVCTNPNAPNGNACNDANACSQTDTCQSGVCTGSNPVICTASDQCHVAGVCNPGTGVCTNPNAGNGTTCNDGNACSQTDTCQSGVCAGSNPVICTASDQCHVAGTCNPGTGVCTNPAASDGTGCTDGNACTQSDSCQTGVCVGASPVVCTASDQCHVAGVCNPGTGVCTNPNAGDGTTCSDGNACSQTDTCQSGVCTGSNPVICTASDQCHVAGVCDTGTGFCSNPAAADGVSCTDNNACTNGDSCQTGFCAAGTPTVCTASDQCHAAGVCDTGTGFCSNPAAADGVSCSDNNACTNGDSCQSGVCSAGTPTVCTASDQCHVAGVCDTGTGFCSNPAAADGVSCSDNNACTNGDSCQTGVCAAGTPTVCTASDQCHVAGVCDTGTGFCSNPAAADGVSCSDNNACTNGDSCQSGVCSAGTPTVCTASDQCHVAGVCDTGTGFCSNPAAADGVSCSDNNACTNGDSCQTGVCAAGTPTVCTASDQCHVAGVCDTGTGFCSNPAAADGVACSDNNACTNGDSCQSGACSAGTPTVCAASDQCHVAGVCDTGTGFCSNPAAADGVSCTDNNACTNGDSCQTGVCAAGTPTVCTASDQCHVAGVCDTGTGFCSNPAAADGVACTDNNACTTGDSCQTGVCAAGTPTVCTASDQCHVAGVCDTGTGFCSNPAAADGVSCTDNNACTTGDSCQSGACSAGTPTVCTASDQCHVAGVCDTGTGFCSNPAAADGVSCTDNNACTNGDSCQTGVCAAGTPTVCTASDQCHVAGVCDTGTGFCSNPAAADGVSCTDNNACTSGDSCQSGACAAGTPTVCTASDQCHVAGTCNPGTGVCTNPNAPNGNACNDGSACTQTDTCQSGVCSGSNPVVCTASDQCHVAGVCDPGTGVCSDPAAPDGSFCSDGGVDQCANSHACQAGVCVNSDPVVCQPLDQCHVAGVCIPETGLCTNPPIADGTGCNDSNACTQSDSCQAGACVGASPVVCTASDQCHVAGVCNPGTGFCSNPAAANGTSCTDGNACTNGDSCQAGACSSGAPTVCSASDQCHVAGVCDTGTGFCSNPAAVNGTSCTDNNACTNGDSCQSGACSSGAPTVCSASDQCHVAGVCDTGTGFCSNPAATNGTSCTDNNACTQSDSCQTGVCVGASPVVCTASDQCHVAGVCNPGTGFCSNPAAANGTSCTDGNACTNGDSCQAGACSSGAPTVCSASDQCHVAGVCDTGTGFCSNPAAANGTSCTDNNACTNGDSCQSGACSSGAPTVCSASDQCHVAGVCDTGTGFCSNPAAANGVLCTDNNACTTGDSCQSGACSSGTPTVCAASDQCHVAGVCNPGTGFCSNPAAADGVSCTDNNACTNGDSCQSGACSSGAPTVCSASDQCHVAGVCDTGTGFCSNPAASDGMSCTDGSACTTGDTCQSGACTSGTATVCSASDQCHVAGTCDPGTGFCSNPAAADGTSCTDGSACTTGDTCQSGACTSGTATVCTASDQCHVAGTCDPGTGFCSNPAAADGTACTDGNACTQLDSCQTGDCVGSSPVICTAGDQCHVAGTCDPGNGFCSNPFAADGTACTDGNQCTDGDACTAGVCGGAPVPPPAAIGDSVRVDKTPTSTTIAWNDPPGLYNVYRGSMPAESPWSYNQTCANSGVGGSSAPVATDPAPDELFYYLVSRATACGESSLGTDSTGAPRPNASSCP